MLELPQEYYDLKKQGEQRIAYCKEHNIELFEDQQLDDIMNKSMDITMHYNYAKTKNEHILNEVEEQSKHLVVDKKAMDKIQDMAHRTSEICGETPYPDMEIGAYTTQSSKTPYHCIEDLVIWPEQKVSKVSCEMPLDETTFFLDDIYASGHIVNGWTHSHNTMPTFHSGTDDRTTLQYAKRLGYTIPFENKQIQDTMRLFSSIVVNQLANEPSIRLRIQHPLYILENGRVQKLRHYEDKEYTPTGNRRDDIRLIIREDPKHVIKPIQPKEIIKNLRFSDGGRLSDYFD